MKFILSLIMVLAISIQICVLFVFFNRVGIAAGITFYFCVEYNFKDADQQQIQECITSGLSEEICKGRVY